MKVLSLCALIALGNIPLAGKEKPASKAKELTLEQRIEEDRKAGEKFMREAQEASRLADEMAKDKRKPSKKNISGNWTTGPNLCGTDFQLEQKGDTITGRGYDWGCLGRYSKVKVTGTYRDGRLTLTVFRPSDGEQYTDRLTYAEEDHYPQFIPADKKTQMGIRTQFECREREKQLAEKK